MGAFVLRVWVEVVVKEYRRDVSETGAFYNHCREPLWVCVETGEDRGREGRLRERCWVRSFCVRNWVGRVLSAILRAAWVWEEERQGDKQEILEWVHAFCTACETWRQWVERGMQVEKVKGRSGGQGKVKERSGDG